VIDLPIGRDKFVREKMAVRKIESGAKEAVTRYEVLETFGEDRHPECSEGSPCFFVILSAAKDLSVGLRSNQNAEVQKGRLPRSLALPRNDKL